MCNQAVSLVAATIEQHGIGTVAIQLLREIAERVRPPRALLVPFPHGYPLGAPNDAALQKRVLAGAFQLWETAKGPPPVLEAFEDPRP